jgi:hypothetical protein
LSPASNTKFGAQIFKENGVLGVHPIRSVAESLAAVAGLSMCRGMQFWQFVVGPCASLRPA